MALYVHVHVYTPPWPMRSGFDGKAVAQTNAPPLRPQPALEFKLPVVLVQLLKVPGAAVSDKPKMVPLGAKPRSTDPI